MKNFYNLPSYLLPVFLHRSQNVINSKSQLSNDTNMTLEHLVHHSANQIIESWFPVVSFIFDFRKLNVSIIISLEMQPPVQKEIQKKYTTNREYA
jgi:hypothetical protein